MISFANGSSLLNYLTAQGPTASDSGSSSASAAVSAAAKARLAATAQTALDTAGSAPKASAAGHALDKQQAVLANELRAAMNKAGVKLAGTVDFSVSGDGKVEVKGADADVAATKAFLNTDTGRPSFALRIATQANDALKLSATIQQHAAISQAARYAGKATGVMALYASLMQQSTATTAVFSVAAGSSSLSYPGSLATKA